jgi:hypothetical protein
LKNWKTTLAGGLAVLAGFLHAGGIGIGHFGSMDFTQIVQLLATGAVGLLAKDHNVTGGKVQQ